jgi:hypothetical protein
MIISDKYQKSAEEESAARDSTVLEQEQSAAWDSMVLEQEQTAADEEQSAADECSARETHDESTALT